MTRLEECAPPSAQVSSPDLPTPPSTSLPVSTRPVSARTGTFILILSLVIIAAWLLLTPGGLLPIGWLEKANLVGYAICHQIDERSFFIAGRQLPLCARCTGIYLGVFGNLLAMTLLRRWRSAGLPRPALIVALVAFIGIMGVDGLNSYMTFFPGAPHLYEPHNWLRLFTGMFHGIALSALLYPIFNQTLWADADWLPALRNFKELALVVLIGAIGATLTVSLFPILLYPLALISGGGVLTMLTMINTIIVVTALQQENRIGSWRQSAGPLALGLALALVQVSAMDAFRFYLTQAMGLPF